MVQHNLSSQYIQYICDCLQCTARPSGDNCFAVCLVYCFCLRENKLCLHVRHEHDVYVTFFLGRWSKYVREKLQCVFKYLISTFPLHRIHRMHCAVYGDRWSHSVVSHSLTWLRCAKMAAWIEILYGVETFVDPGHILLDVLLAFYITFAKLL